MQYSRIALIGALVAIAAFATGALLFIADSGEATQRLGILFALFGAIVTGIISALKSDTAAQSTNSTSNIAQALNGAFEARVRNSVRTVNAETPDAPETKSATISDAITAQAMTEKIESPPS